MTSMTGIHIISILKLTLALGVSAAVVFEDLRRRRIHNSHCVALLATGVASAGLARGWTGLEQGLLGAVVGFAAFLIPYGLGGLGGGDVKLMAGFGAMTGIQGVVPALFLTAATGAATSILYMFYSRMRGTAAPVAIPYAPAIVAGSLIVAVSQLGGK